MSDAPTQPKSSLSAYTPSEVDAIVTVRCRELAEHLGWTVTAPAVRIVPPDELREAMLADVRVRAERVRGAPTVEAMFADPERSVRRFTRRA